MACDKQGGDDRRIDAARQPADHPVRCRRGWRIASIVCSAKSPSCQVPVQPQTRGQEVAQDRDAERRVRHLGMELEAVDRQRAVLARRRSGRCRSRPAARSRSETRVTWSPWLIQTSVCAGTPANRSLGPSDAAAGAAVLPRRGAVDLAAQGLAGQLHPVADAQHGDAQVEDLRIALGGARLRRRSTARRRGSVPRGRKLPNRARP